MPSFIFLVLVVVFFCSIFDLLVPLSLKQIWRNNHDVGKHSSHGINDHKIRLRNLALLNNHASVSNSNFYKTALCPPEKQDHASFGLLEDLRLGLGSSVPTGSGAGISWASYGMILLLHGLPTPTISCPNIGVPAISACISGTRFFSASVYADSSANGRKELGSVEVS